LSAKKPTRKKTGTDVWVISITDTSAKFSKTAPLLASKYPNAKHRTLGTAKCVVAKIRRAKIPKTAPRSEEEKNSVGSVDCVGPLTPQSIHHNHYIFFHTFRNFIEVDFGDRKNQAQRFLKAWVERIDQAIKFLRSDNGGEYQNAELHAFFETRGITSKRSGRTETPGRP
jgi:hypothetical protein